GRQACSLYDIASDNVEIGQARPHGGEIQGQLAVIRMGKNATIGDGQDSAAGQGDYLMGADTSRGEFGQPLIARPRTGIVDAQDAAACLVVVFSGQKQSVLVGKDAMSEKVAAGRNAEGDWLARAVQLKCR